MGLSSVVHSDPEILGGKPVFVGTRVPEILGGKPVFVGTRVPLRNLIDYLEGNHSLEEFLEDFPNVSRDQVITVLEELDASAPGAR